MPLGPYYGTVAKFGTSDSLTALLAPLWKGKIAFNLRCPNDLNMGLNMITDRLRIAALFSVGEESI